MELYEHLEFDKDQISTMIDLFTYNYTVFKQLWYADAFDKISREHFIKIVLWRDCQIVHDICVYATKSRLFYHLNKNEIQLFLEERLKDYSRLHILYRRRIVNEKLSKLQG